LKQDHNIENQFDSLFKEVLENADVKAPEGLWQQIATQIPASPAPSVFSGLATTSKIIGLVSVAAVVGVVVWNVLSPNTTLDQANDSPQIQEIEVEAPTQIETFTQVDSSIQSEVSIDHKKESNSQSVANLSPEKETPLQSNTQAVRNSIATVAPPTNDKNIQKTNTTPPIAKSPTTESKPVILGDTFLCQRNFKLNRAYFGVYEMTKITQITVAGRTLIPSQFAELEGKEFEMFTIVGLTPQNQQLQRIVHLNNKSIDIQIENTGAGSFKASYQTNGYCVQNYWYINNEIKDTDIKDIVYYRNLEFEGMQQVELKMVCYDDKQCVDSVILDATPYLQLKGKVTVPNIFTPNNDGLNDVWQVMLPGATEIHIKVYNQDQQVVFQTSSTGVFWDGNDLLGNQLPSGSYMYLIHYAYPKEKPKQIGGFVKLIRN
jgi:gliding motility-associated-like protein